MDTLIISTYGHRQRKAWIRLPVLQLWNHVILVWGEGPVSTTEIMDDYRLQL